MSPEALLALASSALVVGVICVVVWVSRRGWRRGADDHRGGGATVTKLIGDVVIAVLVFIVTAVASVPVWTWLLGLR